MTGYDKYNGLVTTPRWAGKRVLIPETDSDHVWGLNALAIEFVCGMPDGSLEASQSEMLKELIYRISLHDVGECFYQDITRTFKYHSKELADLIHKTENELIDLNLSVEIAKDVKNSKSKDPEDIHGFIVSIFDVLQAGLKMREEIRLGNEFFRTEIYNSINLLKEYINILLEHHVEPNEFITYIVNFTRRYLKVLEDWNT